MTRPPVGLRGLVQGADDGLVGGFVRRAAASSARVRPVTVMGSPWRRFAGEEALGEEAGAACVLVVLGDVLAAGGKVADERGALGDDVEVVHFISERG